MKMKRLTMALAICIALGVTGVIVNAVFHSVEAQMAIPMQLTLKDAQFSNDGGESWQEVGDGAQLRREKGDIAIRGYFDMNIEEGWMLNLFLQHMQMRLYINHEEVCSFATVFTDIRPEWCADLWVNFRLPQTSTEDLVEFRFTTFHQAGVKGGAYEKMLNNIRLGDPFILYQWINGQHVLEQYFGMMLMIIGLVLMGIAFASLWMKTPLQSIVTYTALLAIGEGLFWIANASEVSHYVSGSVAFFNTGRSVSRMLTVYALLACMAETIKGRGRKMSQWIVMASGIISAVFLVLGFAGIIAFCEAEWLWQLLQAGCLLCGLFISAHELFTEKATFWNLIRLVSIDLSYLSLLIDIGNYHFGWYSEIHLSRYVCGIVTMSHAASLLLKLPASHAAIRRAEVLTEELRNSRVVLAMSQIRTHFIFNVLNAISGLCKIDPELADAELVRFSRYLRNNIDIMQEDRPIPFEKALDHMHNYVDLEQLRFEEKILLDENYEFIDFMIPTLVVQPLVENAIKHGLLPREEGGMIRVSTRRLGDEVEIEIADNGVGFDIRKELPNTSVGLSNVRFRVEHMMGGRMTLESTPGKGTVVRVYLPVGKEGAACTLSV